MEDQLVILWEWEVKKPLPDEEDVSQQGGGERQMCLRKIGIWGWEVLFNDKINKYF